jgi:hypothetical protein
MDDSPSRLLEATVVLRTRAEISPRIYQENRKGEDILCSLCPARRTGRNGTVEVLYVYRAYCSLRKKKHHFEVHILKISYDQVGTR